VVVIPMALADPEELPVIEPRQQKDDLAHTPGPLL
jgi:hypothetical protein